MAPMHILKLYTLLWMSVLVVSCGKDAPKPDPAITPEELVLNFGDSTMSIGSVETIIATILPENSTDKSLEWSSSDPMVVSVNAQGRIEALKVGLATITATTRSGRISKSVNVQVDSDEQRVAGWFEYFTIPERSFTAIEVYLSNASNKQLTVKRVDVYGENETLQAPQPNTFDKAVPANSASRQIYVQDSYSRHIPWYYALVYFEMNNIHYAIKISNAGYETVRVEQINVGSETEWGGENTIEIP